MASSSMRSSTTVVITSFILVTSSMTIAVVVPSGITTTTTTTNNNNNGTVKELRVAWFAPSVSHRGVSARSNVNVLKVALRIAELRHLSGYKIRVKWYDSKCDSIAAMNAALAAGEEFDPHLFLGPPCSEALKEVGMLASLRNVPVFSWLPSGQELQDRQVYTTLVRMLGLSGKFGSTLNILSSLGGWNRFSVIYDEDSAYRFLYEDLVSKFPQPPQEDQTIVVASSHSVSSETVSEAIIRGIFLQIKSHQARVILLTVPWMSMRKYMLVAHQLGMTSGEFVFICANADIYTSKELQDDVLSDKVWRKNDVDDDVAKTAFESVIYLKIAQAEGPHYSKFEQLVAQASDFSLPHWDLPAGSNAIDSYSPFLFDAMSIWAILANRTLETGGDIRNGTSLFRLSQGMSTDGLTGPVILDTNGDREQNLWLLDMGSDGRFHVCYIIFNTLRGTRINKICELPWPGGREGRGNAPSSTPGTGI